MPTAREVSDNFRRSLLARESAMTRALIRSYSNTHGRLNNLIGALEAEILRLPEDQRKGWQVMRLGRWKSLRQQVEDELVAYGAVARDIAENAHRESITAGLDFAYQSMAARFPPELLSRIAPLWHSFDSGAVETALGYFAPGSPLLGKLNGIAVDGAQIFEDLLTEAVQLGYNPRKWGRVAAKALSRPLPWALNWARTTQLQAYRQATLASYKRNAHVVRGWRWSATLDQRVCLSCLAMDGTEHGLDETLDDHHQGRCLLSGQMVQTIAGLVPIEQVKIGDLVLTHLNRYKRVLATSQRPYAGRVVEVASKGCSVAVTPEHPILTQRGWVAAKDVSASDILRTFAPSDVRSSRRSTIQPSDCSSKSLRLSIGHLILDLCQRGSSSTASMSAGNAKSMLKDSMASCGTGLSPTSRSTSKKRNSLPLHRLSQSCCRLIARAWAALSVLAAFSIGSKNAWLASISRRAAVAAEIGSTWHWAIRRITDLLLIPVSAQSSRYVALSSMYRRRSQAQIGSSSLASKSARHRADLTSPVSWGDLLSPSSLALWLTALGVRPGSKAESWRMVMPWKLADITDSSCAVHFGPMSSSFVQNGVIIHQPCNSVKWSVYNGAVYNLQVESDESFMAGGIAVHNCAMEPITVGWRELGFDIDEPPDTRSSAREWFEQQSEATQRAMFRNNQLYEAWKGGQVGWGQLSKESESDVWGRMLVQASYKDVMAALAVELPNMASVDGD